LERYDFFVTAAPIVLVLGLAAIIWAGFSLATGRGY
jgi:hypothetical protein